MGLKDYAVNFVLVGIVFFLTILFVSNFQTVNDSPVNILNDNTTSSANSNIEEYFLDYNNATGEASQAYYNNSVKEGFINLRVTSAGTIGEKTYRTPKLMYDLIAGFIFNTLAGGDPAIASIITMIGGLILVVGIMYIVKFIVGGTPE